jgi:hypothetical protein
MVIVGKQDVERDVGRELDARQEQGVHLADGAVDPPPRPHLSEMQDELLLDMAWHLLDFRAFQ